MRLFIGLPIPSDPRLAQVTNALREASPGVRPVPPGTWHVTVRFLGEVEDPVPVEAALQQAVAGHEAMPCRVEGVSAFQSPKRARVVWAKVHADGLRALARDIIAATKGFGEAPRGDFVAHATLARMKRPEDLSDFCDKNDQLLAEGELDRVVLYRSRLTPEGPTYERRLELPLTARRPVS